MNTFPDSSSLLRKGLSYTLDTAIIESFIYFLRRTFLNKNVLILSPFNISRLSAFQDGTASQNDVSREIQTWWEVAINEMNSISDGKFLDIPTIAGVMFSNPDMAQEKTLKIPLTPNEAMGHFVFFTLDCKSGITQIFDTMSDSFANSHYFSRVQCKRFFDFLIQSRTFNFTTGQPRIRTVRDMEYSSTSFSQQGLECGVLACFNLVLFYNQSADFLKLYKLQNPYATSISNIKTLLIYILLNRKLPDYAYKLE